jgi:sulfofructose kinase
MAPAYDVIVYGTVGLDTIWRVERLPPPGGYAHVLEERWTVGGTAANSAIALARWGARVALVGNAIGDDEDGRRLRELLAREAPEIDTRFLPVAPDASTPAFVCVATSDGHRTMYGRRTAGVRWPALAPELARSARLFTLDPYGGSVEACAVAAREGLPIVAMDCAGIPSVNAVASLVVTSYENVGADASAPELAAFAAGIRDRYGVSTIVTWGERGCLIAAAGGASGETTHLPAYVAPEVVDSTGAGDLFRAGMVYGLLQEWDLLRSARFASAAAALNCGAMGGWCGVRPVEEIEQFQKAGARRQTPDARGEFVAVGVEPIVGWWSGAAPAPDPAPERRCA